MGAIYFWECGNQRSVSHWIFNIFGNYTFQISIKLVYVVLIELTNKWLNVKIFIYLFNVYVISMFLTIVICKSTIANDTNCKPWYYTKFIIYIFINLFPCN